MASDCEEVEIKIEYNEISETDPLGEIFITKMTEFLDNENLDDGIVIDQEVDDQKESNYEDNLEDENIYENCTGMISTENQATWYKQIDPSGKYLCQFCDLAYSTVQTLRHHVKLKHPDDAKNLKNLILNNKRNSKLKCHICKTRFKIITELKEHVKRTHELQNLKISCKKCDATFSNEKEMSEHLFLKHKIKETKFFSCLTCGYRTSKKSHFNQHENTHLKQKFLKCESCDYSTNYLPNFKIHVRIHTNQKPYSCDYKGCSYNSVAKSALRSHQLKHNREANMIYCDKCSYKTVYKQSLKKHIDSHERNSIRKKLYTETCELSD